MTSQMNVSMRMTFDDLASGPLKKFAETLKGLEPLTKSISDNMASMSQAMGKVSRAASSGASGTEKLEKSLATLQAALEKLNTNLATSSEAFLTLRSEAFAAGNTVKTAAEKMDAASLSTRNLNTHVNTLAASLKGMAALWAGMKIDHGLKESVKSANDWQTQISQMRSLGLNKDAIDYAKRQAWVQSGNTPYASAADVLASRRAIIAGTGANNEKLMNAALPQLIRDAYAYKNLLGSKASISDIIGNFAGIAEIRGMSQTSGGLTAAADQALQVALATQGRMKAASQEVVLRQFKYGGAQRLSTEGYRGLMALAEQYTLAGHEGGAGGGRGITQMGTAYSMLLKTMLGGRMNKVTAALLHQMGMFEQGGLAGGTKTTSTNFYGVMRGTSQYQGDLRGWIHDVLGPRMLAYVMKNAGHYFAPGANIHSMDAQQTALERLAVELYGPTGGVNVANLVSMVTNPNVYGRSQATMNLAAGAKTGQSAVNETNAYQRNMDKFTASVTNLKIAIGNGLLPVLTPMVNWLAKIARVVTDLLRSVPGLSQAIGILATAFSGFLTFKGFEWMFGSLKDVIGIFGKVGPAAEGATVKATRAFGWMGEIFGKIVSGMLLVASKFGGGLFAAFSLSAAILSLKISGVSLMNYMNAFWDMLASGLVKFLAWIADKLSWALPDSWAKKLTSAGAFLDARRLKFLTPDIPSTRTTPHSAPNEVAMDQKAQNAAASILGGQVGGLPDFSKHHKAHKPKMSAEERKRLQAINQALRAVASASYKEGGSSAIRAKWKHYADILKASGHSSEAAQALQIGDHLAKQEDLKTAKTNLSDLQSQLSGIQYTNAALVQSGVLTPDQAQQNTLQAQREFAPKLIAAAQAVQQLEQELGKTDTKIAGVIEGFRQLGHGLTQFQQKISNTFEGAFQGLFSNLMHHNQRLRQTLAQFFTQLSNGF
ncbi:MAG: phage tail tape measure protein, partial [Patescibacteria group bacterium]|nr:phage tail tape measure protein [Patescibacteria group bacterium]